MQQARIALMDTIITDYIEFGKKLIALRRQKGDEAVNELVETDFGENFMEHLNVVVDEIDNEETRLLAIRKVTNEKSISNFSKLLVVLEVLIVSLLIVGFRVISNNTTKRNKAESDLKRNNYFISSIINNSHNPISIRDRSGKYILANNPFSKIFNVGVDEIIGKRYNDLYAKEVTDLIEETDAEILGSKNTVIKEYHLSLHDGTHFYSSASFPLFDESNNIYAIASILTDFTLINKGKEALNRSNKTLQQFLNSLQELMDTSLDVICIIDEEGRFTQLGSACERILGYTAEELTGRKYIDFVHKDDVEKTNEAAAKIMSGARYNDFENRYCKKDGKHVPLIWVAIWSEDERLMYCIARDGTEKKQTLKQLKESGASLTNAQKIARLGSWEVDLQKGLVYGSDEFYVIIGKTKEQLGNSIEQFLNIPHPEDRAALRKAFEITIHEKSPSAVEFRIIHPNGTLLNVHCIAEIIVGEDDKPKWLKGTMQDITWRKKLEEEREVVIEELTKSNADLKQFSFITSHNFRAPLSNITAILNLLNYNDLDNDNKELLEMLKTSSLQLSKTIDDLTNMLVIKNNVNEAADTINFKDIYKKIEKVLSYTWTEAGAYIVTDFKVPFVKFNAVYLESILINLVSNAINYRSRDRSLLITIKTGTNTDGATTLSISDNGKGIDLTRHGSKIFGLYQRFHENTKGNGLGLFIIKSQVDSLGGKIEVESEVDKGTTFIITFKGKSLTEIGLQTNELEFAENKTV